MERRNYGPAPIFNHRKRPRQAVIADPQDTKQSSNRFSDLMPVGGFGAAENQQRYNGNGFQQFSTLMQQTLVDNSGHQGPPTSNMQGNTWEPYGKPSTISKPVNQTGAASTSFKGGNSNYGPSKSYGGIGNRSCGNNSTQYRANAAVPSQINRPNTSGAMHGQNMNQQRLNHSNQICRSNTSALQPCKTQSYGNNNNFQNFNKQNYSGLQSTSFGNNYPQYPGSIQQNRNYNTTTEPGKQRGQMYGLPVDRSPASGSVFPKTSNTTPSRTPRVDTPKNRVKPTSKNPIDPSLHVMTISLNRIAYWSKYRDSINMMVEVFGVIDSAVVWDSTGTHKEFILRDEQQHMKCTFYEIDRSLPKLIRGQWHRCMGTYDHRNSLFKCVSVRPATVEEKNHGKLLAEQTNELLKRMTEHLPEQ